MDVNYKNQKRYNTSKLPIRQPIYLTWLIWLLSKIVVGSKKHKIERIDMDGLKPPYIILSNHMSFIDFELLALGTYPQRMNNVVNIDGYYMRPWLMEWIGAICTRKFTTDFALVKSILHVLKNHGDVLTMYPEARYSPCGATSYLPDSIGKLIKMARVPVVAVVHRGNYLHSPVWNVKNKRKVPMHTTIQKIITADEARELSVDELNLRVKSALVYDEYKYQLENDIKITEKYRAEGMHKILYKCPHCEKEFKMTTEGAVLRCTACSYEWELCENGQLISTSGESYFTHVPSWYEWQREMVKREIEDGTYYFEDTVDVYSMPACYKFPHLGKATLTHSIENGFVLEGNYRDKPYRIQRTPLQSNSLHVEYEFPHIKKRFDCVDISTENDSFYCYPSKENVVTKLALATEELYKIKYEKIRTKKETSIK